jgi:hypothetical protein
MVSIFNKNKSRVKGLKRTSDHINVLRQFTSLRIVKEGYPVESRNFSIDEVNDYFNHDTITCLLCGKEFQAIRPLHMTNIHNKTLDEYREMFGLPYRKGLVSKISHYKSQKGMENLRKTGKIKYDPEYTKMAHESIRISGCRRSNHYKNVSSAKAKIANQKSVLEKKEKLIGIKKRIFICNNLIKDGISTKDALLKTGLNKSTFYKYKEEIND